MADASLSALLALAAHELRQPTGIVRGYLSMLESDLTLAARARNVIDEAARGADKIAALLDEVVALARLRDGSFRPALKSMSLRSVLNQAVQAANLPAGSDVELDVIAPVDVRMRVDEARLRDVFRTLISMLARAQAGAVTIDVMLAKRGRTATVTVTPRSLGRGTAVEQPIDLGRGGSGMQLPIAEAIVHAHRGRLRERWIAGRWSGFIVRL